MQSIWPYDHAQQDSYCTGKALDELWCFMICPAKPPAYWDDLFALINGLCEWAYRSDVGEPLTL
jgi:hypothetical protein